MAALYFTSLGTVLATVLLLYPIFRALNKGLRRSLETVVRGNLEMAMVLGSAISQRDSGTSAHNFRVALYAIRLAESLGEEKVDMIALVLGALLHDVGKIGVPDAILLKPGRLTDEEARVMKTHVQKGLDIIESSHWLQWARGVVQCHHERYDGRGYPSGLSGLDIPMEARIFAIVDVFDALTSPRPYRTPMPFQEAMDLLDEDEGRHFDPVPLGAFRKIAQEAHRILSEASEEELQDWLRTEVENRREALFAAEQIHMRVDVGALAPIPAPGKLAFPTTK